MIRSKGAKEEIIFVGGHWEVGNLTVFYFVWYNNHKSTNFDLGFWGRGLGLYLEYLKNEILD